MRLICRILVCMMILCIAAPATAEMLTFQTFSADSEAEYLNLVSTSLYDMPQLRVLIIAAGDAKDITPIGSLKHLEYLEIFNNAIEDISCLKDMPYLMDRTLSTT